MAIVLMPPPLPSKQLIGCAGSVRRSGKYCMYGGRRRGPCVFANRRGGGDQLLLSMFTAGSLKHVCRFWLLNIFYRQISPIFNRQFEGHERIATNVQT